MGYIQQFAEILTNHSVATSYHEAIAEWVDRGERFNEPSFCICGHDITENCVVINRLNNTRLIVGNCCIRKFGVVREHWNKSRKLYLEYALTKASTDNAKSFIGDLMTKLQAYPTLKMSEKQREWLVAITGKPYRWNYHWEASRPRLTFREQANLKHLKSIGKGGDTNDNPNTTETTLRF